MYEGKFAGAGLLEVPPLPSKSLGWKALRSGMQDHEAPE
jgi:hypothetical protein